MFFSSVPINSTLIFTESGGNIKFSAFGELIAAVNNLGGNLKVINLQTNQIKLSVPVTLSTNIAWHSRCPIVCVGCYTKLNFWRIVSK